MRVIRLRAPRAVSSETGDIWVRRWPAEDESARTFYDVYTREGNFVRSVLLSRRLLSDPPPYISATRMVGVYRDPEMDVHKILIYALPQAAAAVAGDPSGAPPGT